MNFWNFMRNHFPMSDDYRKSSGSLCIKKYYAVRQLYVYPFSLHYALNLLVGHFWGGILLQEIKNGQF